MSKPEHSPLPWYVSAVRGQFPRGPALMVASECDGHGYAYIPYSDRRPGDHASSYADAQFIVTACNSYYENKAAIAELVTWITNFAHADLDADAADAVTVGQVFQKDALRLIAKHKAGGE